MQPVRLSFVFYDIKSKWISHRHSGNVYMRSLCGIATAARPRTATQRRVVDFVRVGYFIPLNGPLNGHPPSNKNDSKIYLMQISVVLCCSL